MQRRFFSVMTGFPPAFFFLPVVKAWPPSRHPLYIGGGEWRLDGQLDASQAEVASKSPLIWRLPNLGFDQGKRRPEGGGSRR